MSLHGQAMWSRSELAEALEAEDARYLCTGPLLEDEREDVGAAWSCSPKETMHGFFGEVIRGARDRRGMTAEQLATAIQRSAGEVSSWETGRRPVSERVMLLCARAMECTLAELFAEELATRELYAKNGGKPLRGGACGVGFLGDCIRMQRLEMGIAQGALGARVEPPVAQPQIAAWENGASGSMSERTFVRVAKAFELTSEHLIARELLARGVIVRR